jgi:transposase
VPDAPAAEILPDKKTLRASEQGRADIVQERQEFCAQMAGLDPKQLVFIDESGINTKLTRLYGRAPRHHRAFGSVPFGHYERLTVLGALAQDGLVVVMTIAAATTKAIVLAFLRQVLIPVLRQSKPGATVLMDNLSAHKSDEVVTVLQDAGFNLVYLPRSSPDLSPIEPCWSKVKTLLRRHAPRSLENLEQDLPPILDAVTAHDAENWFKFCGYRRLN